MKFLLTVFICSVASGDCYTNPQYPKVLNNHYDYVIVDSPPVLPVSDTMVIAQATDYLFYVVRSDVTRLLSLMSGVKKLKNINKKLDGFILNDLDTSKHSYYGYYYQQNYYYSGEDKTY